MKALFFIPLLFATPMMAQVTAASCSSANVQTAINTATEGQTVTVPNGSCTWTSGVSISGKGIVLQSAGNTPPLIVAVSTSTLSLSSTSAQSLTITTDNVAGTLPSLTNGQPLLIAELGVEGNFIKGNVSSYNSSTGALTVSYSSHAGTCGVPAASGSTGGGSNCKRWLIISQPTNVTTILNNVNADNGLIAISEDTGFSTKVQGFDFEPGTIQSHAVLINYTSGGLPVLVTNNRFHGNPCGSGCEPPSGNGDMVDFVSHRGVVWGNSFDSDPFQIASLGAATCKDSTNATGNSWTTVSTFGTNDTNQNQDIYIETNDFHAFGYASGSDDNCRMVERYNFYDNSGMQGSHGADTSNYGSRYFEIYNNVATFFVDGTGNVFNLQNWVFWRGGTGLVYNNTLPVMTSSAWGAKPDINATVENLQRNSGPHPCWGAGTSGGADYHAPRQPGAGRVTGTGTSPNSGGISTDAYTYVGDLEPLYVWGNSRSPLNWVTSDYGSGSGDSCSGSTYDTSANYIVSGRDYYNGSTAKPSYTPATYPNPLTGGTGGISLTATTAGAGTGNITGTNCTSGSYTSGTAIGACTATATGGSTFSGWSASGSSSCTGTGTCGPFNVTTTTVITATFAGGTSTCGNPTQNGPNYSGTYTVPPTTLPLVVGFTSPTSGCTMHYTTDGSSPTCGSAAYSGSSSLSATTTVRVIACQTSYTSSSVMGGTWTINGPPGAPTNITIIVIGD